MPWDKSVILSEARLGDEWMSRRRNGETCAREGLRGFRRIITMQSRGIGETEVTRLS
jgi:hypothetical protein